MAEPKPGCTSSLSSEFLGGATSGSATAWAHRDPDAALWEGPEPAWLSKNGAQTGPPKSGRGAAELAAHGAFCLLGLGLLVPEFESVSYALRTSQEVAKI